MKIKLLKIDKKIIENNEDVRVFDITVNKNHSYTVGSGTIVHNCLTTQNVGVGYPMGSLIRECYEIKIKEGLSSEILADGGFKKYSDVIKSIGLGSNGVMLGSILNKTIESSGDNYLNIKKLNWKIKISKKFAERLYKKDYEVYKKFRGMSTKEVQRKWGREILKTSEGVVRFRPVEYTLKGWTENFTDYLKSAMSYSNALTLDDYIGKVEWIFITNHSYDRFNK